jgi:hypothetical protein
VVKTLDDLLRDHSGDCGFVSHLPERRSALTAQLD